MTDTILRAVILAQTIFLGTAFVLYISKKRKAGGILWILAEVCACTLVANNFLVNGYVPFVSMYQILTFRGNQHGSS